jgi:hypothetical protein
LRSYETSRPSADTGSTHLSTTLDSVAKVFLGWRTKILRAADALSARRRDGPYRFIQNQSLASVVTLKGYAATEKSRDQLSRDFLGLFDFRLLQQYRPTAVVPVPERAVQVTTLSHCDMNRAYRANQPADHQRAQIETPSPRDQTDTNSAGTGWTQEAQGYPQGRRTHKIRRRQRRPVALDYFQVIHDE